MLITLLKYSHIFCRISFLVRLQAFNVTSTNLVLFACFSKIQPSRELLLCFSSKQFPVLKMYACILQNCLSCLRLMLQLLLKYPGKAGSLALKAIFYNQDGTTFICILRFLIVRSVRTGKGGGSRADLEEFTQLGWIK